MGGSWDNSVGLRGASFYPRLQEALITTQANNLTLGEKLKNLVRPSAQTPTFVLPPPCLPAQLLLSLPTLHPVFQPTLLYQTLQKETGLAGGGRGNQEQALPSRYRSSRPALVAG